jgi:hypothetical protein
MAARGEQTEVAGVEEYPRGGKRQSWSQTNKRAPPPERTNWVHSLDLRACTQCSLVLLHSCAVSYTIISKIYGFWLSAAAGGVCVIVAIADLWVLLHKFLSAELVEW